MELNILTNILIILFAALIVITIFKFLQIPVIVGYVVIGAIMGPHGIGLIPDSKNIHDLAEFGIVFLMFTIGLHFSLSKLWQMKTPIILLGSLQVILTILITTIIGIMLGMTVITAFIVGSIVAMSSTAIVVKQISDQRALNQQYAKNVIGILLFQDLVVAPLMILIASFSNTADSFDTNSLYALSESLFWGGVKGILALTIIFIVGRLVLKPLFHVVVRTKITELLTLLILLITLASATLTNKLGLSYALGAFLAGVMLAETEYSSKIESEIRPFKDILLGLFFISIGMFLDVASWPLTWNWIILLLIALVFGKLLLITGLSVLAGIDLLTSVQTAISLSQGGEFGFAILNLAVQLKLLPDDYSQVVLSALLISIISAPILLRHNKKIAELILIPSRYFR